MIGPLGHRDAMWVVAGVEVVEYLADAEGEGLKDERVVVFRGVRRRKWSTMGGRWRLRYLCEGRPFGRD